jgi:hypothetical protein
MRKKAVSPAQRRAFAHEVVGKELCSQRAACRILRLARSTLSAIFWQDFVQWRTAQNSFKPRLETLHNSGAAAAASNLPPRAAQILREA